MLSGYSILLRTCAAVSFTAAAATASAVPRVACATQIHYRNSSQLPSAALAPADSRCTVVAAAAPRHRSASALAMATQLAPRAQEVLDFW
jgi:hypothetical protein